MDGQRMGFLLRVLWAGPSSQESVAFVAKCGDLLGGSTLGAEGMGWSILLYLSNVVDRLDSSTISALRLGCTTLVENTGRGGSLVGGLSGDRVGLCIALMLGSGVDEGKKW